MERKQQLCWTCKKSCGGVSGCSWFNGYIPIPGWTAVPTISDTVMYQGKLRKVKSFQILKCPLYEREIFKGKALTKKEKAGHLGVSLRTYYRKLQKESKEKNNDSIH